MLSCETLHTFMSTPGAMGAIGEDEEDPSPSLSLLQRLKKLREWQERQRQELLQTQAYTPSRHYLPPVAEETPSSFESTITEDSMSTPVAAPQRVEDYYTPTGLPGAGSSSSVSPLTSDLQDGTSSNFESTGIEDSAPPTPPMAVPQGCHTPEGSSGIGSASPVVPVAADIVKSTVSLPEEVDARVQEDAIGYHTSSRLSGTGSSSPVVPVASYILVKRSVGFPEEVNARLQEEDAREKLPIRGKPDTREEAAVSVREREGGKNERQGPPLTSQGPSVVANLSHPYQNDPEKCDERNDVNVRETEYGANQITDTQEENHYSLPSASISPHDDPNEHMDESMEDLMGGERRVQYSSEKYKSSAPIKDLRVPESSQAAKNLISSRPFFSGLIHGSEEGPKVMEETPRPRRRFLKRGEGTARFRMRPMRLRKPRTSEEEEGRSWQGNEDVPQMPSPAATPVRSQFRVPVHSLQLQGTPRCDFGPVLVATQQCILPARPQAPTYLATHSARHPVPNQQPIHPARPPGPTQLPYHFARPPAPTQQPTHTTFHPPPHPTTHNPASTLQPTQSATLPSAPNPARHPSSTLQLTQTTTNPTRPPPNPYRDLEKQQRKEAAELSAFEKLEELAEDSSFSSNSSTVVGLLRQGQHSVSSTPMRTPPPLALQETPVVGSCNTQPKNLESQFLGDMINRVLLPAPQHQQAAPVDVKEVLAQLKAIVRLEGHSVSDITESDIQTFLDGCSSDNIQPSDVPHLTSTPASPQLDQPPQTRPHHVHFATEGVQVLEYQLSDTEGEDTLTDATSLDSDMMTTSDLEALTHLKVREAMMPPVKPDGQQVQSRRENSSPDTSSSGDATLTEQEPSQGAHPVVLSFSPPPPRPPQSASHYIWSIFGKERDGKKLPAPKPAPKNATKEAPHPPPPRPQQEKTRNAPVVSQTSPGVDTSQEELEVHKTLLLAKVAELEKETKLFKKDNAKLQALQQDVKEEKRKLGEEKQRIQEEAKTERKRFQEYVDRERNALWNERQKVLNRPPPPAPQPQEHLMEVIRLREQVREMQEEAQRKESLNQFTIKKLNDRIKALENENKRLQARNKSLENLEKENQDLRLKLDRAKASGRMRPGTQPTQSTKATRGRPKTGTRPTTVDGVAKTLERLTRPQPVIVKEAQTKATTTKQDLVNNNLRVGAMETEEAVRQVGSIETEEAVLKQGGSTKTPLPHLSDQGMPDEEEAPLSTSSTDALRYIEGQAPLLCITEEAGLEHTERVREDGVREVIYANGNRKEIHPNGDVTVSFYNGDRKEVKADRTVYVYGSDQTSHTAYSDGREEFIFPGGQRETRHPDGSSEISFPDGSLKSVTSDGTEICTTKDGSIVRTNPDGSKVFEFPSGQREVHRNGEKRREYPNGTVKIVHPDGRTETRYSSGRLRIRDRDGNVILDSHVTLSSPPLYPHSSLPS